MLQEKLIGRHGNVIWSRNCTALPDPGTIVREIRAEDGTTGEEMTDLNCFG